MPVVCTTSQTKKRQGMKNKVATVTIDGREHNVTYHKKVKNLVVEYMVQVHDRMLKQKGVENYRFHLYSKNIIFPDGTKSPSEKQVKQKIAEAIAEVDAKF